MKKLYLLAVLLGMPILSFGTTVYKIEPNDNRNATHLSATQSFVAICDTIKQVSFLCGSERDTGSYNIHNLILDLLKS